MSAAQAAAARRYERSLRRAKRAALGLLGVCSYRPGLLELAEAETVVCRCEAVCRSKLDVAIERGAYDLTALKMATRVGMGDCQGKVCGDFCGDYLAHRSDDVAPGRLRPRFPLAPVPFAAMARPGHE